MSGKASGLLLMVVVSVMGAYRSTAAADTGAAQPKAKAVPSRSGVLVAGPARKDEEIVLCRKEEGARARGEVGPEIQAPAEPLKLRSTPKRLSVKECDAQARKWNFWTEDNEARGCFVNMFVGYPEMVMADVATGLQWVWGASEEKSYPESVARLGRLNAANWQGHHDWRLPTSEELLSLFESVESARWKNHFWEGLYIEGAGCWTADPSSVDGRRVGLSFDGACSARSSEEARAVVIVRTMTGEEWSQARQKYKPLTRVP